MNENQIHDYLWAVQRAEQLFRRGDAEEIHVILSADYRYNRVSVIDSLDHEMVLFSMRAL